MDSSYSEDFLSTLTQSNISNILSSYNLFLLLDNLPIAVFAKSAKDDYRFIFWNKYAENLFGLKREEIIGKNDYDFFDKNMADFYRKTDEFVFAQREIVDIPLEEIKTHRGLRYAHTKKFPLFDENGQPYILIGVLDDITELIETNKSRIELIHQLEEKNKELNELIDEKIKRNQQLETLKGELENNLYEKNRFLQIIAHDLRNPLAGILPFLEILNAQSDSLTSDDIRQISSTLLETTQNFRQLLENLLEWATLQNVSKEIFQLNLDINEEINQVINLFKLNLDSKQIKVVTNLNATQLVKCDHNMLQTILRNLMSNAIKFSPLEAKIFITTSDKGDEVEVNFTNSGEPISEQTIAQLFSNQIVRSKPGTKGERGSGLGFLLVKEYVYRNNGKLKIEALPKLGTSITITFKT